MFSYELFFIFRDRCRPWHFLTLKSFILRIVSFRIELIEVHKMHSAFISLRNCQVARYSTAFSSAGNLDVGVSELT